nr:bifunctional riboflavin kinase/FAD synthetase [Lentibacillus saliphilus]
MAYPHSVKLETLPETVAAIGFFDGIHRGHQKVIESAVEIAKAKGNASAVITFDPHPSVILNPNIDHVDYITPLPEKQRILTEMNVDRMYIISFDHMLSKLSPQEFIDHFIIGLNIKHLIAGFDFSYGHKGQGNVQTLEAHSRGQFLFTVRDKVESEGEKISSTKIRQLFSRGDVRDATHLLGRYPRVWGIVIEGYKRGRTLGYPTANIDVIPNTLLPAPGVYAVFVHHNDKVYKGMASLGFNPTFEDDRRDPSLEVFIFNFSGNLYGDHVQLEWCTFIRQEKKFNHVSDLVAQMKNDEKVINTYFDDI